MQNSRLKLLEQYGETYRELNAAQQKAVDTIEGPVLVNAGPGTGKTQVLALRIGNILRQTDADPGSILCLTYTENGAVEMRNRLLKFIGSAAYNVRIHTFHSFCNEVIQDNLSYFGRLNLEPISELEEIDLFYALIDRIPKDNPLKRFRGDVYYEKNRLRSLYSLMKKEAWQPEWLEERIDAYLEELPQKEGFYYKKKYRDFNAGDPKPAAIADETEKMEMLRAAARLFPQYNAMMAERGRYNFDDMILWVLDAFDKNSNLLADYQERFLYFLVDEFQDTSRSQNLLLQQLTGYWDRPNVFVVGDADQSIFSFQDANVENILAFEKKYRGGVEKIDLVNNYRSTQAILDAVHGLITHNQLRTVDAANDRPLVASRSSLKSISEIPRVTEYPNAMQEAIGVCRQVEQLWTSGVSGKEIAIIYRNHAQAENIVSMLEAKGIAVNMRRKVDLLQVPFVGNIISMLAWVAAETNIPYSGDDILFKLLHCDFFTIPPLEIAKLSITVNEKNKSGKGETYSLRRLIAETGLAKPDLFSQGGAPPVKAVSDALEMLLKASVNHTLQQLLEKLVQQAGVLTYVMQHPEKPWLMQVLNAFFNFVKEETKRNPALSLAGLLENMNRMEKNGISMPLYKVATNDKGVNMVTAHSSKGSEFAHVFVIGCTESAWDDKNGSPSRDYKLPDNLVRNNSTASSLEESRRLFYVAITRAKTHLYISYPLKDNRDRDQVKSSFVTELLEEGALQAVPAQAPDDLVTGYLALQFAEKARPEIALVEDGYINQLLKNYTLSVTHLNNFLYCPLKFYYQNLVRVPAAKSESMTFGSAVHYAMEMLFKKMKSGNDQFPPPEDLLKDFLWYMHNNREAFTPEAYKRRTEYGEKILPAYYDYHIARWNKIVVIEKMIRNVTAQNVPINGKLDKLEFNGREVNIVDYKTGSFDKARKKFVRPGDKEPNGGDYWRQAVFYKILLDNDKGHNWNAVSTEFDFIEPYNEEYKTEKITVTPADMATVTHQLTDTWQKIQQKAFTTGCGRPDCEWCSFVKTNKLAVALHEPEEEAEEA